MTDQETFDALLAASWQEGQQQVSPQALADWLLDHAPAPKQRYIAASYRYSEAHSDSLIVLTVYSPSPDVLRANFTEESLGVTDALEVDRDGFADAFPAWLIQQMDFLYYLLSK